MCFFGFGCCGPPPHATIKAYDNTTPWALDWYDDKAVDPHRESAVDYWPSATPPSAVVAIGGGLSGATNEGALLVRDTSDGSRHEESVSTPLSAPSPPAGRVTMVTDNSTVIWWTQISGIPISSWTALAFNSSLVQQCRVSSSGNATETSAGRSGTSILIGTFQNPIILRRYNTSGTDTGTFSAVTLSKTLGRVLGSSAAYVSRDGATIMVWGLEGASGTTWRRHWRLQSTGIPTPAFSEMTATTGAVNTSSSMLAFSDVGRGCRLTSTHFFPQYAASLMVMVEVSSCNELWTLTTGETFVAIDASRVYTIDLSTKTLTARAVATGTTSWTLDLTGTIVPSSATYGKILSGGYLAVLTPTSPVAIVNPTTGALVTSIDVGAYDIVERDSRYIVVGPKRTTES